jgi:hypothetical protein
VSNRTKAETAAERFWPKVHLARDGCWVWTARLSDDGYGELNMPVGCSTLAHRVSLLIHGLPQPGPGLTVDHLCRNRACVNPAHLEIVTNRVNILRGIGPTATNSKKTHCLHGHLLSGANLRILPQGRRRCRTCHRLARRLSRCPHDAGQTTEGNCAKCGSKA